MKKTTAQIQRMYMVITKISTFKINLLNKKIILFILY